MDVHQLVQFTDRLRSMALQGFENSFFQPVRFRLGAVLKITLGEDVDEQAADAADRRQHQRDRKARPRGCRFDFAVRHGTRILHAGPESDTRRGGFARRASVPARQRR